MEIDVMGTRGIANAIVVLASLGSLVLAQPPREMHRRATMVGGGGPDRGRCTVEVLVDGRAQVEVRGDDAILRDLSGAPPQWRRFECTGPMPAGMADFRFAAAHGRGEQRLVQDPRTGGAAVVEINDPKNGSDVYAFDLIWERGAPVTQERREGGRRAFTMDEAIRGCQDAIRQQTAQR